MGKVTLQVIADKLGVSKALVSKALSNDPAVKEETRELILKTADEMGYFQQQNARRQVGAPMSSTGNIAVVLPRGYLGDFEYWGKIIHGIDRGLAERKFSMLLSGVDVDQSPQEGLPFAITEKRVDGILFLGQLPNAYIDTIKQTGLPVAAIDTNCMDAGIDHVLANNFLGGYLGVMSLLKQGHVRIGFIGNTSVTWSFRERRRGCEAAIRDFTAEMGQHIEYRVFEGVGVSGSGHFMHDMFKEELRKFAAEERDKPIALFCANDMIAFDTNRILNETGIQCPDDISIMGFDDLLMADLMNPKLSTLKVPIDDLGDRALRLLFERIGQPDKPAEHVLLSVHLVERQSVKDHRQS